MARPKFPDPLRIRAVESNVKLQLVMPDAAPDGFWRVDIEGGANAILVGDNSTGKSAFTEAVHLALGGYADDIQGRNGVRDTTLLWALAPEGATSLFSNVYLSDGTVAKWSCPGPGKKAEPVLPPDAANALAVDVVKATLAKSEKEARKDVLSWVTGGVSEKEVFTAIPTELQPRYRDIAATQNGNAIDKLLAVSDYAELRVKELRKVKKSAEDKAKALGATTEMVAPTVDALAEAAQAVAAADAAWKAAVVARAGADAQEAARAKTHAGGEAENDDAAAGRAAVEALTLARDAAEDVLTEAKRVATALERQRAEAVDACTQWEEELRIRRAALPEDDDVDAAAGQLIAVSLQEGGGLCFVCGSRVGEAHLHQVEAFYAQRLEAAKEQRAAVVAAEAELRKWMRVADERRYALEVAVSNRGRAAREVDAATTDLDRAERRVEAAAVKVPAAAAPEARSDADTDPAAAPASAPSDAEVVHLSAVAERARTHLANLKAAAGTWEGIRAARNEISAAEADIADFTRLVTACRQAAKDFLQSLKGDFEQAVTKRLPMGLHFRLDLEDNGREVLRVGIAEDVGGGATNDSGAATGPTRYAQGGAEWEMLTMALADVAFDAAATGYPPSLTGPPPRAPQLKVSIPRDRAWSPRKLGDTARVLRGGPVQVFIPSTVAPFGGCPAGWVVLETTDGMFQ